jgi:hypothetical protein
MPSPPKRYRVSFIEAKPCCARALGAFCATGRLVHAPDDRSHLQKSARKLPVPSPSRNQWARRRRHDITKSKHSLACLACPTKHIQTVLACCKSVTFPARWRHTIVVDLHALSCRFAAHAANSSIGGHTGCPLCAPSSERVNKVRFPSYQHQARAGRHVGWQGVARESVQQLWVRAGRDSAAED